jgi:alpha-beta hydrolase superfamily lysophospholipase
MFCPRLPVLSSLALIFLAAPALGQPAQPAGAKPLPLQLVTKDNQPIGITYYESAAGKESPVVVLLHGANGNQAVYQPFAEMLQAQGIAAVTVDLRKHGESKTADQTGEADLRSNDYQAMVLGDLPAVKKFLYDKHQEEKLNMRKTGIVAADMSAPIAINFARLDWLTKPYNDAPTIAASTPRGQDVRAIVLLSPDDKVTGVTTTREILDLRAPLFEVSFLIAVGDKDKTDRGTARKMYDKIVKGIENPDDRMFYREYSTGFRGTELLGRGRSVPVEGHMLQFFKLKLQDLQDPWRDRKSRI